ncbi:MAG: hypothetical protein WDO71_21310 [Bacteroidota bacterium]
MKPGPITAGRILLVYLLQLQPLLSFHGTANNQLTAFSNAPTATLYQKKKRTTGKRKYVTWMMYWTNWTGLM